MGCSVPQPQNWESNIDIVLYGIGLGINTDVMTLLVVSAVCFSSCLAERSVVSYLCTQSRL